MNVSTGQGSSTSNPSTSNGRSSTVGGAQVQLSSPPSSPSAASAEGTGQPRACHSAHRRSSTALTRVEVPSSSGRRYGSP
ncbi:MAG: hypothetical protein ABMA64_42390, partial [Myxococcota bacterium]